MKIDQDGIRRAIKALRAGRRLRPDDRLEAARALLIWLARNVADRKRQRLGRLVRKAEVDAQRATYVSNTERTKRINDELVKIHGKAPA